MVFGAAIGFDVYPLSGIVIWFEGSTLEEKPFRNWAGSFGGGG